MGQGVFLPRPSYSKWIHLSDLQLNVDHSGYMRCIIPSFEICLMRLDQAPNKYLYTYIIVIHKVFEIHFELNLIQKPNGVNCMPLNYVYGYFTRYMCHFQ